MGDWQTGTVLVGHMEDGIVEKNGLVFAGLGLFLVQEEEDGDPPCWSLTHLNSGMRVVALIAHRAYALKLATKIAGLMDWTFVGLDDWRNLNPDLPTQIRAIAEDDPSAFATLPKAEQREHDDRPGDARKASLARGIAARAPALNPQTDGERP